MSKIQEILQKLGLSIQESRVYYALLELQESQTGRLCNHSDIARSNIYHILKSLIDKGLVHYRLQNNIKVFMPAPPETLNELFLEKQRKLEEERKEMNELITHLKKVGIKKETFSKFKYYEGLVGIKSMWHELNNLLKKGSQICYYTSKKKSYENLEGFYKVHQKKRVKKNVKSKIIFPKEERLLPKEIKKFDPNFEFKFMDLQNDAEWGIVDDSVYIQYIITKKPIGFLIKDEKIANTFKQVFEQVWEKKRVR